MIWSIILQRINEHNNKKIDAGILLVQTGKASSKGASSRKNSDTRRPPGTIQYYLARHAPRQSHTFVIRHSISKFFFVILSTNFPRHQQQCFFKYSSTFSPRSKFYKPKYFSPDLHLHVKVKSDILLFTTTNFLS